MRALKDAFELFDSDGDGYLSVAQFVQSMRALRHDVSPEEVRRTAT